MPLAGVWTVVLRLRHTLYDWGILPSQKGALPTLVVGNVELGGTGKTPHVLDAVRRLQTWCGADAVGILSRGYGRKTSGFLWVSEAETWDQVGDEPWLMHSELPEVPVAVCEDRLAGLRRMAKDRPGLRVVVLDDGLQHRALAPDRSMALAARPCPSRGLRWGRVVPAGPWRDLLPVCSKPLWPWTPRDRTLTCPSSPARCPPPRAVCTAILCRTNWTNPPSWSQASRGRTRAGFRRAPRALAGVAHYPDHHPFSPSDLSAWVAWMKDHGVDHVLTTPKDAVRILPTPTSLTACVFGPCRCTWNGRRSRRTTRSRILGALLTFAIQPHFLTSMTFQHRPPRFGPLCSP